MSLYIIGRAGGLGRAVINLPAPAQVQGDCDYGDEQVLRLQLFAPRIESSALQVGLRNIVNAWSIAKGAGDCAAVARLGERARRMLRAAGGRGGGSE